MFGSKAAQKKWFISHPSGGPIHTPLFYETVRKFGIDHKEQVELVFPHEMYEEVDKTKQDIESVDLIIAEVSIASTGSGIELGWANSAGKSIIAFYQGVEEASPAIKFVTQAIHPYITEEHITKVLEALL